MKCFEQPLVLVDIETTGLSPVGCRIIEIACIRIERGQETARFVSLVDPGTPLPKTIQSITGIGPAHLIDAPTFVQIADDVEAMCEGAIFVAHNARFDYSFIKAEMKRIGRTFNKKTLCTVKLSRKLFPEHPSHGLSAIIDRFGFICAHRHRALGDTEILVQFLNHIENTFERKIIQTAIQALLKKTALPPQLDPAVISLIPDTPGVYTFFDKEGTLLYVGKSKNLRSRIMSHFGNTHREGKEMRLWRETASVEYTETISDLGASLLELYKIKTESPMLNRLSRRTTGLWILKKKRASKKEYASFELSRVTSLAARDFSALYGIFRTRAQAQEILSTLCHEQGFCPLLMGIEKSKGACFSHQIEKCSGACVGKPSVPLYNLRIEQALASKKVAAWPGKKSKTLTFTDKKNGRAEVFVIDHWILKSALVFEEDETRNLFPLRKEESFFDFDMYKILVRHLLPPLSA